MINLVMLCLGTATLLWLSQKRRAGGIAEGHHYLWDRTDIYMIIAILWITCFSFLRTDYNDTAAYISMFRNAPSIAESAAAGTYLEWADNPLSYFYRDLMRTFTDNYHIYFFFPALLHAIAVVKLFRHYSEDPGMSMLIYFAIGTYVLFLAAFKQSIAMTVLLLALPYAEQKRYVRFYLLLAVAVLFHFYAIVFALAPLLLERPWKRMTWILLGLVLFCLAYYEQTLGAVIEYVESLGERISEEEVFDGNSINILRVLVYWVPALMAFLFQRHLFYNSTPTDHLFANLSIMGAMILTIGLAQGANLFARMAGYFEIGMAVTIPWMLRRIFTRESARLMTWLAMGLFFGYFVYEFTVSKDFSSGYSSISLWQFFGELIGWN